MPSNAPRRLNCSPLPKPRSSRSTSVVSSLAFPKECMASSPKRPIRFVCRLASLLVLGAVPSTAAAQQVDAALVGQLARLLAVTDARRYDVATLREALRHPNPAVRRQGALAAARIGDATAVEELIPL